MSKSTTIKLPQLIHDHPFGAPSIPDRMQWTASSLKLFRRCKRKFYWKHIFKLRPAQKDKNLAIGHAFHACLGNWYKNRRSSMSKLMKPYATALDEFAVTASEYYNEEDLGKTLALVEGFRGMMLAYAEVYHSDRTDWRIKDCEVQFKVDCGDFDFMGKIDLIATEPGRYMLVEHKTASRVGLNESYLGRLPLDTQVRGYLYGAINGLKYPIKDVVYNVIKKSQLRRKANESVDEFTLRIRGDFMKRPEWYFLREPLRYNTGDLHTFELGMRQTHDEYLAIIKGDNPLSPHAWTPNDTECNAYFRLCEYHDLCIGGLETNNARFYQQGLGLHAELETEEAE